MKRAIGMVVCVALGCMPIALLAQGSDDDFEASMLVTGTISVKPDGSLQGFTLDERNKLPASVVQLVDKELATWKFKSIAINGGSGQVTAKMSLRVVESERGNGPYHDLRIRGVSFGDSDATSETSVTFSEREAPDYPGDAVRAAVSATVYLALEIGRDGQVRDVIAQQVNVRATGAPWLMRAARAAFADATVAAAKNWTFNVPVEGPLVNADHWTVRVPVNFVLLRRNGVVMEGEPKYGEWDTYTPGPVQPIPWEQDQVADGNNADAIANNGMLFLLDDRFVLMTSMGG